MPAETEIIEQLTRYSDWLESEVVGADLSPSDRSGRADRPEVVLLDPDADSSMAVSTERVTSAGHPRWLAIAAVVMAMAGGLYVLSRPDGGVVDGATDEDRSSSAAAVSDVPLYVLPASLDGFEVEWFDDDPIVDEAFTSLVVGEPTDWGFDRVVRISVSESSMRGNGTEPVVLGGRTGVRRDVGLYEIVGFDLPDGRSLTFTGDVDDTTFERVVAATRVAPTGIEFDPIDGMVPLGERDDFAGAPQTDAFFFEPAAPTLESSFWISTLELADDDVIVLSGIGSTFEWTEVRGRQALISRHPGYFDFVSLVWFESPNAVVRLSAPSEAEARELAEGLRIVDQATWDAELSALPMHEPIRPVLGYPHGTLSFRLDSGEVVQFEPDGAPIVVVAVRPNCSPCLDQVASLDAALDGIDPDLLPEGTRFVAVALEDPGGLDLGEIWSGPVLRMSPTASDEFTEALEVFGILLLDGTNTSITSLSLADSDVVDQLLMGLADTAD